MCLRVPKKVSGFGMLNNVKVKNESARVQQKRWFAEKSQLNGNSGAGYTIEVCRARGAFALKWRPFLPKNCN